MLSVTPTFPNRGDKITKTIIRLNLLALIKDPSISFVKGTI